MPISTSNLDCIQDSSTLEGVCQIEGSFGKHEPRTFQARHQELLLLDLPEERLNPTAKSKVCLT